MSFFKCALVFSLSVCLWHICVSQVIEPIACPKIDSLANVDSERLLGLWYQMVNYGEPNSSCIAINLLPGKYDTYMSQFSVASGQARGRMVKGVARYIYLYPETHFDIWLHQPCADCSSTYISNMRVLTTDYDTFALFFHCEDIDATKSKGACTSGSPCSNRILWLLSRSGDAVSLRKYNKLVRQRLGLSKPHLREIDQFGCPAMPDFMYKHGMAE